MSRGRLAPHSQRGGRSFCINLRVRTYNSQTVGVSEKRLSLRRELPNNPPEMTPLPSAELAAAEFALKTTPPRAPKSLLVRSRLSASNEYFQDRPVVVVQASAGFGKTSLLAQWRREYLAGGAAVAWISADDRDDPQRFLHSLVHAVRIGAARPAFGRFLLEGAVSPGRELEAITAWLAEVTQISFEVTLIVDDAERLPSASVKVLTYLLHNAPQNLRIVVAARGGLDPSVADLAGYGQCACVDAEMLRFRLDETIALLGNRFGTRLDIDSCARLHELSDGWPLGLQLAVAAIERESDPRAALNALSARISSLHDNFLVELIAKLSSEDQTFLVSISVVDLLHPDLCVALTGQQRAPEILARLVVQTPIFATGEDGAWCRLHTLARDALRARLAHRAAHEQADLHLHAMHWFIERAMFQEAASHAYAAGKRDIAYDLAERCLHDAVKQGQLGAVMDWFERLPETELQRRPRLRLAASWALALSERHAEAKRQIEHVLAMPQVDIALRYECALILSAAAYYADEIDRFVELFEPWTKSPPPVSEAWLLQAHANRLAVCAILRGDPAQARRLQQLVPLRDEGKSFGYRIEIMALRAFILDRSGEDSTALLLEAMNLANTFNLTRIFADAPPLLSDWATRTAQKSEGAAPLAFSPVRKIRVTAERAAGRPHAVPSMVLTPKEREVLELLARNLTNKEIASAMAVGEETVKWHLKNLFGKLDAGTRKHVVRRAVLLGLLEGAG